MRCLNWAFLVFAFSAVALPSGGSLPRADVPAASHHFNQLNAIYAAEAAVQLTHNMAMAAYHEGTLQMVDQHFDRALQVNATE